MNIQEENVKKFMKSDDFTQIVTMLLDKDAEIHRLKADLTDPRYIYAQVRIRREAILCRNDDITKYFNETRVLKEGLKTVLAHASNALECVGEPCKGYLREICDIVDKTLDVDTSEANVA